MPESRTFGKIKCFGNLKESSNHVILQGGLIDFRHIPLQLEHMYVLSSLPLFVYVGTINLQFFVLYLGINS